MTIIIYDSNVNRMKQSGKYNNKKITYDGHTFDSKKEYQYYIKLKEDTTITDLQLQVTFELVPKIPKVQRAITYKADFTYYDNQGTFHVIDVKGMETEVFKIKKKLFRYRYGYNIEIV